MEYRLFQGCDRENNALLMKRRKLVQIWKRFGKGFVRVVCFTKG